MRGQVIHPSAFRAAAVLAGEALQPDAHFVLRPAAWWEARRAGLPALCWLLGRYGIPTVESIAFLRAQIAGRSAIEIGAGAGDWALQLGIPATDSKIQETAAFRVRSAGSPPVIYGSNVEKLDALAAVEKYQPSVVIGSWVTQLFDPCVHHAGEAQAFEHGIDELALLARPCVETCLVVGNMTVHGKKRARRQPHQVLKGPSYGLVSRAAAPRQDCIFFWHK